MRRVLICAIFFGGIVSSRACDLCGCFTPQVAEPSVPPMQPGWYAGLSEQFTYFGTLQFNGDTVPNPTGQYLASSITQLFAGYEINPRFALQLNLPVIYREFKRPEGFTIQHGNVFGIGDLSLLLRTVDFTWSHGGGRDFDVSGKNPVAIEHQPDLTFSAVLLTGIKFPTGDTSRLEEEFHEVQIPGAPPTASREHMLQFTRRGDGDHQYHFANDLVWSGGPGYYFLRNAQTIAGLQFELSGEYKDVDRFRGKPADDTGVTSVFLGPRIVVSHGRWSAEVATEVPALIHHTPL